MSVHLSPLDYTFWAAQIVLVGTILLFAVRSSLYAVQVYAVSRLAFDLITLATLVFGGHDAYNLAFWVCKPLEYACQAILAVACVGEILKESRDSIKAAVVIVGSIGTVLIALIYVPVTYTRMLDIEAGVNLVIAIGIAIGLAGEVLVGMAIREPWETLSWGMVMIAAADAALRMFTGHIEWDVLARLYPIAEISALGVMSFGVYSFARLEARLAAAKKEEVRLPMSATVRGIAER